MFGRLQAKFNGLLESRISRVVRNANVDAIIQAEVDRRVSEALRSVSVDAIEKQLRDVAEETIRDDCDVDTLVDNRIEEIDISDHIDYEALASEIDYDDLSDQISYISLATELDYSDLEDELDYDSLASEVDHDKIAVSLKDNLCFEVTVS